MWISSKGSLISYNLMTVKGNLHFERNQFGHDMGSGKPSRMVVDWSE